MNQKELEKLKKQSTFLKREDGLTIVKSENNGIRIAAFSSGIVCSHKCKKHHSKSSKK
tara:strand:+ start:75929 stop:76102 length:174 start_codon:yes stop_codon:yes gene_type:complete